jgi:hypothetical protein
MAKYHGEPYLVEKELDKNFSKDDFVFLCDMLDWLADNVPCRLILKILDKIRVQPARFLSMTKNPERYLRLAQDKELPDNLVLGTTVETDYYKPAYLPYSNLSKAPPPPDRLYILKILKQKTELPLFLAAEPILDFSTNFASEIINLNPWAIAVGYDNHLTEPSLAQTMRLIEIVEQAGIKVYRKTLREKWNA